MAALVALAAPAQAGIIYQQSFGTDTSDLLTEYGFTQSGLSAGNYRAAGGQALWDGSGIYYMKLQRALSYAYDWSSPLTLSADLSTTATTDNVTYGIWMANLGFSRNVGGYLVQGRGGDNAGGNQITNWLENQNALVNGTPFNIAITIRQNEVTTENFDVLFQVNGVDQGTGWYTGLSKASYGLNTSITQLGIRADGIPGTQSIDNLKLEIASTKLTTATTLASSAPSSYVNDPVTFTATVKDGESNNIPNGEGTVKFESDLDGVLDAAATITDGVATCLTSTLRAGTHKITATYSGDSTYAGSASSAFTQTVNLAGGGTDIIYQQLFDTDTENLTTTYGFTAAGWAAGGSYTAAGGEAVIAGTGLAEGSLTHTLSQSYAYDWSNPLTLSADLRNTQTSGNSTYGIWMGNLGFSRNIGGALVQGRGGDKTGGNQITGYLENQNPLSNGTTFNIAITVRQTVGAGNEAKFDVLFQVNGVDQGTGWYTGLSKSTYGLGGNLSTLGIRADGLTGTVYLDNLKLEIASAKLATSTTLGSSAPSSYIDDLVTFTATVKVGEVNVPTGAGTVEFKSDVDGVLLAAAAITDGVATCPTSLLSFGPHTITATYSGDSTHLGSSTTLSHSVIRTVFGTWAYTNITARDEHADASSTGDPDGDGSNNLTEYAFSGDPLSGTDHPKVFCQVLAVDGVGGNELVLTVAVLDVHDNFGLDVADGLSRTAPSATGGITYRIQGSDNLVFPGSGVVEVGEQATEAMHALLSVGSGYEYRSFVLSAGGLEGKGFLRAVVTKQ
jgi:hypothetical protein